MTTTLNPKWAAFNPPADLAAILTAAPSVRVASTVEDLIDLACGGPGSSELRVAYDLPDGTSVLEAIAVPFETVWRQTISIPICAGAIPIAW